MKEFILDVLKNRQFQQAEIGTEKIVFSKDVVAMCEMNSCGRYGTCWTCPPGVGELDKLKKKFGEYPLAFVFTTKNAVEDSFDIEGMFEAGKRHGKLTAELRRALKTTGKDIAVLGNEGCGLCEACTYPDAPCRHPDLACPSVEACGIDVVQLAATCGINYYNGPNTVTYFSVVFYYPEEA